MNELTIMTEMQQMPDEGQWRDEYSAEVTDFAILSGVFYAEKDTPTIKKGHAFYWYRDNNRICLSNGQRLDCSYRCVGYRPALMFSSNSSIPTNGGSGAPKRKNDWFLEGQYGFYPQKAASLKMQEILEQNYIAGSLKKTRREYTTNSRDPNDFHKEFSPKHYAEYEFIVGTEKKRYVRVEANPYDEEFKLSNGGTYKRGDPVWVEVLPVDWLINEKQKIMVTDKIIISGIEFSRDNNTPFNETTIKRFLDTYLSKELEQSREIEKTHEPSQGMTETVTNQSLKRANTSKMSSQDREALRSKLESLTYEELEQGRETLKKRNNAKRQELKKIEEEIEENETAKRKKDLIARIRVAEEEGRKLDEEIATVKGKNKSVK